MTSNCGLGTVAPMVRFNCRPEITVFTLRVR
jgi:predicted MPP superfamily phosphohydrolase